MTGALEATTIAASLITTGFHGLHVIIGTTFLSVCLIGHIIFISYLFIILDLKQHHDVNIS
ncbi:Cytochrome c oxidase subunit 3 [Gryllus bimaculatus]|nr:Cytochrome c oxidase subunit 3 [Gryllus bimaculatus]